MSDMQIFYGTFAKSDLPIIPVDEDEFYDMEAEHGCQYIDVDGQLYMVTPIEEIDACGFSPVIEPSAEPRIMALWYNGGAGEREVIEAIIRRHIK